MKGRGGIKNFLVVAVSLCLGLLLAEGFLRLWDSSSYFRTHPGDFPTWHFYEESWVEPDPDLGWTFNRHKAVERDGISYAANPQGFRDPRDFKKLIPEPQKTRVMVLGDSFVFGSFLDSPDTLARQLEKKLGPDGQVFNLGVPAWGVDQMWLAYQKYGALIQPQQVVLVFIDDDILRVFEAYRFWEKMNKPAFEIAAGKLRLRRAPEEIGWFEQLSWRSRLVNKAYAFYRSRHSRRIAELIFRDLSLRTRAARQKLIVIRYPGKDDFTTDSLKPPVKRRAFCLTDFFQKNDFANVSYLDLYDVYKTLPPQKRKSFYLSDGHPSAQGNDYLAGYLAGLIRQGNVARPEERTQP